MKKGENLNGLGGCKGLTPPGSKFGRHASNSTIAITSLRQYVQLKKSEKKNYSLTPRLYHNCTELKNM